MPKPLSKNNGFVALWCWSNWKNNGIASLRCWSHYKINGCFTLRCWIHYKINGIFTLHRLYVLHFLAYDYNDTCFAYAHICCICSVCWHMPTYAANAGACCICQAYAGKRQHMLCMHYVLAYGAYGGVCVATTAYAYAPACAACSFAHSAYAGMYWRMLAYASICCRCCMRWHFLASDICWRILHLAYIPHNITS